jgi:hypothetical protein
MSRKRTSSFKSGKKALHRGIRVAVRVATLAPPDPTNRPLRLPLVVVEMNICTMPRGHKHFLERCGIVIVEDARRILADDSRGPARGRISEVNHSPPKRSMGPTRAAERARIAWLLLSASRIPATPSETVQRLGDRAQ